MPLLMFMPWLLCVHQPMYLGTFGLNFSVYLGEEFFFALILIASPLYFLMHLKVFLEYTDSILS